MKKIIFSFLILLLFIRVNAQSEASNKLEQGILFSPRIDSDDDFEFKIKGFGIEGGYYFLKKLGRKGMISLDLRLAYGQSERNYVNLIERRDYYSFTDTIQTRLTGTATYKNTSLAFPIKFRYQLTADAPIFLLIGFNPYFNLINKTNLKYDLAEYNTITKMNISEMRNLEENVKQRVYAQDILLAGFGYKKDRLMFDVYFSGGSAYFEHPFLGFIDKLSVVLNAYFRLN